MSLRPSSSTAVPTPLSPLLELNAEALRNPHPCFEQLGKESRAWWSDELGVFVVTR